MLARQLLIATFCSPALLWGQSVRGVVVDVADRPVAGVVMMLLDSASNVTARALTNEQGEFRLTAPGVGIYRIRSTRIGSRPLISDPLVVTTGEITVPRLVLSAIPFPLDTVRTQGKSACRMTARDSALATWAVWEQARAALTAGDLTAIEAGVSATVIRYSRTVELTHRRIVQQAAVSGTEVVGQAWRSVSADSLRRVGYVSGSDSMTFSAPGLDVLASDAFLEDHCFHLAVADSSALGVVFEPTRERKRIPEVRGTVWLDRKTSDLQRLEFAYVNVSKDVDGEAGGEMEFVRMRNGAWAISRWNIRMPHFAIFEGLHGFETRLADYQVTGGELVVATLTASQGRDTLWARPPLVLAGRVVDSVSLAPVRGARVALRGALDEARSDGDGRFSIPNVLPGSYVVEVRTPSLDSLGAAKQAPIVFTDSMPALTIRVPTGNQMVGRLCGSQPALPGIVFGTVSLRKDSMPGAHVLVSAAWTNGLPSSGTASQAPHVAVTRTDTNGLFTLCGVPIDNALVLTAETQTASATPAIVQIVPGQRVGEAHLILDSGRVAAATLVGIVLNDSTREPIRNAEVSLPTLSKLMVTNEKGEFRLTDIAPGQQRVRVRRLGYGVVDTLLDFSPDQVLRRTIYLARVTTLDSVLVAGTMRDPAMDDFNEHRHLGLGHFFTRDDLAKFEALHLTDVLAQTPGVAFVTGRAGQGWLASSHGVKSMVRDSVTRVDRASGASNNVCYAQVYLDNALVYASKRTGTPSPLFDINSIPPSSVEAIEYYAGAGQIPAKYMRLNSECGVLVVHTRR